MTVGFWLNSSKGKTRHDIRNWEKGRNVFYLLLIESQKTVTENGWVQAPGYLLGQRVAVVWEVATAVRAAASAAQPLGSGSPQQQRVLPQSLAEYSRLQFWLQQWHWWAPAASAVPLGVCIHGGGSYSRFSSIAVLGSQLH